jgi:hypothetical protein
MMKIDVSQTRQNREPKSPQTFPAFTPLQNRDQNNQGNKNIGKNGKYQNKERLWILVPTVLSAV